MDWTMYTIIFQLVLIIFAHTGGTAKKCHKKHHVTVTPVAGRFTHAEGPHWDHRTQKLYLVDIVEQHICKFEPTTKVIACTYVENGPVGVAVPVEGSYNEFVAGSGRDFVLVTWNGKNNVTRSRTQTLAVVDNQHQGNRWNDGKVDSSGRFWGGTIGPEVNNVVVPNQATFYRIGGDFIPKVEITPVTNSNGLAWNLEDDKFYYIDTPTLKIAGYDYDPLPGIISNRRIVFDLTKHNISGLPDGMTIDTDGNLWIALYAGGAVINVNPNTGELLRIVEIPANQVTSVAFGGPLLDILYVTTSCRGQTAEDMLREPYAGYVFAVENLGVRGLIANSFKYD